jgi:hypothetical protein
VDLSVKYIETVFIPPPDSLKEKTFIVENFLSLNSTGSDSWYNSVLKNKYKIRVLIFIHDLPGDGSISAYVYLDSFDYLITSLPSPLVIYSSSPLVGQESNTKYVDLVSESYILKQVSRLILLDKYIEAITINERV